MTYSGPSPADLESLLEAAPQEFESAILFCLRVPVDHVVQHQSTGQRPWLTFPRAQIPLDDLAGSQMACQRSGPCLARARRLSRRRGCGTTAGNSEERIDPV